MQPACRFLTLDGKIFENVLIFQKSSYTNIRNKKILFLKKCSYIQPGRTHMTEFYAFFISVSISRTAFFVSTRTFPGRGNRRALLDVIR